MLLKIVPPTFIVHLRLFTSSRAEVLSEVLEPTRKVQTAPRRRTEGHRGWPFLYIVTAVESAYVLDVLPPYRKRWAAFGNNLVLFHPSVLLKHRVRPDRCSAVPLNIYPVQ